MAQVTFIDRVHTRHHPSPSDPASEIVRTLRFELPSLADEIAREIRRLAGKSHPPRHGRPDRVRSSVEHVLQRFLDRLGGPPTGPGPGPASFRDLGRREYWSGRDPEAIQTAFHVGARLTWRRIAEVGHRAGWPAETISSLAETAFAYFGEISEYSLQGHTQACHGTADRVQGLRRRLLRAVLGEDLPPPGEAIDGLAREGRWRLPATVAAVALAAPDTRGNRLPPAVGPDTLLDLDRPDPCLLVPDPDAPGRMDMLARGLRGTRFAVGPSVPLDQAPLSLRLAVQALALAQQGLIPCEHYVRCADELSTLLLSQNEEVIRLMTARRYGPLGELKSPQRARLDETLLAWLQTGGTASDVAAALHVHPQTVRYRMRQLQEIFGDEMNNPDWRFEMAVVLRAKVLRGKEEG